MAMPVRTRPRDLAGWDPFGELDQLAERVDSLWSSGSGVAPDRWSPPADVEESEDAYTVEIDLRGVQREDVDIHLVDRVLTVTGQVRDEERTGVLRRRTRRVGQFFFSVTLPGEVDGDQVSAKLHDGVLTVRLPKSAEAKPRRIAIES